MTELADLRARALQRTQDAILREALCLDDDLAEQIGDLSDRLDQLNRAREKTLSDMKDNKGDTRLASNPVADIDTQIRTADAELTKAREAADENTVVLVFRRLAPSAYDKLLADNRNDDDTLDTIAMYNALCSASFIHATTVDGEDLGVTWAELAEQTLNHGDRETVGQRVVLHNRSSVVLPFSPRRSASRGRAKK
jgi:hypothetical protein